MYSSYMLAFDYICCGLNVAAGQGLFAEYLCYYEAISA